jgi:uncharacterized protein YqhQ
MILAFDLYAFSNTYGGGLDMSDKNVCPTSIGGQAVIEGVMMKGPEKIAIAIRKASGSVLVHREPAGDMDRRFALFRLPIIRGMFALIDTMIVGVKALTYSAEQIDIADQEETWFDRLMKRVFGEKADDVAIYFTVFLSLVFTVLLFIVLPTFLIRFIRVQGLSNTVMNLFESMIRIAVFLVYVVLISGMKDIRRVFEYHGAEHKVIHCYEHRDKLTPQNAARYSTMHPRCGTNFLLIVMVVSAAVFSFMGWPGLLVRIVSRILLLPIVGGISYEIIRWAGRSQSLLSRIIRAPGLYLQKLTTRQPDEAQLEVAIEALKAVLPAREGADAL